MIGCSSLNFFHTAQTLVIVAWSHPPAAESISPRYQNICYHFKLVLSDLILRLGYSVESRCYSFAARTHVVWVRFELLQSTAPLLDQIAAATVENAAAVNTRAAKRRETILSFPECPVRFHGSSTFSSSLALPGLSFRFLPSKQASL